MEPSQPALCIRRSQPHDRSAIIALLSATDFFRPDEIAVALEVLDEALAHGAEGHYQSYVAEADGAVAGWVCFGATPCTLSTFDIYWIAVDRSKQMRGLGKALLQQAEQRIAERGGRLVVIETSGREQYQPTRQFYLKVGYTEAGTIADFYAPGDPKTIYVKALA